MIPTMKMLTVNKHIFWKPNYIDFSFYNKLNFFCNLFLSYKEGGVPLVRDRAVFAASANMFAGVPDDSDSIFVE